MLSLTECPGCKEKYKELEEFISGVKNEPGILINVLHKAQELFGYLSEETQQFVADKLEVPLSRVYGCCYFFIIFSLPNQRERIK